MRSFWFDPYLWVHLSGLATLPILLELCVVGFAIGEPILPTWLELFLVAAVGIAPVLCMQLQRPFYIFSLVALVLKPEQLTEDQRRLLTRFKSSRNRILAATAPIVLVILLQKLYEAAPIASELVTFAAGWRIVGLLLAAIAFLASNLFLQVPLGVIGVMLTSENAFATTIPYPVARIRRDFTLLGLPVNQILPSLIPEEPSPVIETSVSNVSELLPDESPEIIPLTEAETEDWVE